MLLLAAEPNVVFIGQGVGYGGVATYKHMDGVRESQRLEFPVAEELQLGVSIGLALQGFLPVSVYPRMDFLLRAMDQLVNHLDKLAEMSCGRFKPKVIIRTRVGGKKPLNAGPQHTQRHTDGFRMMLTNVRVMEIDHARDVMRTYRDALESSISVIVVENFG